MDGSSGYVGTRAEQAGTFLLLRFLGWVLMWARRELGLGSDPTLRGDGQRSTRLLPLSARTKFDKAGTRSSTTVSASPSFPRPTTCVSPPPPSVVVVADFFRGEQVDQVGNLAAFATIDDSGDMQFTTFSEQPHPPIKAMAYAGGGFGL